MNEPESRRDEPSVSSPARISSPAFWPSLALSLAIAGMLFLLLLRPIYDVDIFWQVKLGELILANRGPVPSEPFAVTHLGEPLPPIAWLGQAVYAEVWRLGGWPALRIFDALLWVGGFWVVALALSREERAQSRYWRPWGSVSWPRCPVRVCDPRVSRRSGSVSHSRSCGWNGRWRGRY